MKVTIPYCTPKMLEKLREIQESGRTIAGTRVSHSIAATLRARGWIDGSGRITSAGIARLR